MVEKRRGWSCDEIAFIKENHKKLSLHQISSKLSRSYNSIQKKIHHLNLDSLSSWTSQEDALLFENYEHNPEVWSLLPNRSYEAIKQRAAKYKLKRDTGNCPVDFMFFSREMNKDMAYVLGFFTADGCVERAPRTGARISFSQRIEDVDILYKIREVLNSRSPVCYKNNRNETVLYIHNGKLVNDLTSMGYDSNKSITADIPPCVTDEYMPHFIRGLIDGDGSYIIEKNNRCSIQLLSTYKVLSKIRTFLLKNAVTPKVNVHKRSGVNVHVLKYSDRTSVYSILELIYSSSNIHMLRKYEKARNMFRLINGAFARGESPRIINQAQIGGLLPSDVEDNPESKTKCNLDWLVETECLAPGTLQEDGTVRSS